jgi:hypothetical protein
VGKLRVRLSTITPNAPLNITMPLQGRAGPVSSQLQAGYDAKVNADVAVFVSTMDVEPQCADAVTACYPSAPSSMQASAPTSAQATTQLQWRTYTSTCGCLTCCATSVVTSALLPARLSCICWLAAAAAGWGLAGAVRTAGWKHWLARCRRQLQGTFGVHRSLELHDDCSELQLYCSMKQFCCCLSLQLIQKAASTGDLCTPAPYVASDCHPAAD